MTSILGIDAAWTDHNPSGVALIRTYAAGRWECVALAPSYAAFIDIARGNTIRWDQRQEGGSPEPECLLKAAEQLLGRKQVTVVAVDMPMSLEPIIGRREADRAISKAFGAKRCPAHTPSPARPGAISDQLRESLGSLGYRLALSESKASTAIEVYPHPALLCLLNRDYRVPYKAGNTSKYWPGFTRSQRADRLITEFGSMHQGLTDVIRGIPDFLPASPYGGTLSSLKTYEDALDALVCAWGGARYLEGCAVPYGDDKAAIWVPDRRI